MNVTLQRPEISGFKGLNNVTDPLQLDDGSWQTIADNCEITNHGELVSPRGYTRVATLTAGSGAYTTKDLQRFYVIDSGEVRQMRDDFTFDVLKTGVSADAYAFQEVNGDVYYTNGTDFGVLTPDGWRPWGIASPGAPSLSLGSGVLAPGRYRVCCTLVDSRGMESSNSPVASIDVPVGASIQVTNIAQVADYTANVYATTANGEVFMRLARNAGNSATYNFSPDNLGPTLRYWFTDLPRGNRPAFFEGQMYCAEYFASLDQTVIWRSLPLDYHHFNPSAEGITVPGEVLLLRASTETLFAGTERLTQRGVAEALLIGTERAIFSWSDSQLVTLANYGVVRGFTEFEIKGKLFFWTLRGLCMALPFVNLTESTVSVAPGLSAAGMVIERDGEKRYVVALKQGGEAFNSRA